MATHRWDTGEAADEPQGRRWRVALRAAVVCCCIAAGWAGVQLVGHDWSPGEVTAVNLDAAETPKQAAAGASDVTGAAPATDAAPKTAAATAAGPPGTEVPPTAGEVVIHVTGAVNQPGIVRAPAGSRVYEVLARAGGETAAANLAAINLAAMVEDGQQLHIPAHGEESQPVPRNAAGPEAGTGVPGGSSGGSALAGPGSPPGTGDGPINLNTASAQELMRLPRVGPVLAERIVKWRQDHGKFGRIEDLDAVPGIGPGMMAALRDLVRV